LRTYAHHEYDIVKVSHNWTCIILRNIDLCWVSFPMSFWFISVYTDIGMCKTLTLVVKRKVIYIVACSWKHPVGIKSASEQTIDTQCRTNPYLFYCYCWCSANSV